MNTKFNLYHTTLHLTDFDDQCRSKNPPRRENESDKDYKKRVDDLNAARIRKNTVNKLAIQSFISLLRENHNLQFKTMERYLVKKKIYPLIMNFEEKQEGVIKDSHFHLFIAVPKVQDNDLMLVHNRLTQALRVEYQNYIRRVLGINQEVKIFCDYNGIKVDYNEITKKHRKLSFSSECTIKQYCPFAKDKQCLGAEGFCPNYITHVQPYKEDIENTSFYILRDKRWEKFHKHDKDYTAQYKRFYYLNKSFIRKYIPSSVVIPQLRSYDYGNSTSKPIFHPTAKPEVIAPQQQTKYTSSDILEAFTSRYGSDKESIRIIGEVSTGTVALLKGYGIDYKVNPYLEKKCNEALIENDTEKLPIISATMKVPYQVQMDYKVKGESHIKPNLYELTFKDDIASWGYTPFITYEKDGNMMNLLSVKFDRIVKHNHPIFIASPFESLQDISKIKTIVYIATLPMDLDNPHVEHRIQYALIKLGLEWIPPLSPLQDEEIQDEEVQDEEIQDEEVQDEEVQIPLEDITGKPEEGCDFKLTVTTPTAKQETSREESSLTPTVISQVPPRTQLPFEETILNTLPTPVKYTPQQIIDNNLSFDYLSQEYIERVKKVNSIEGFFNISYKVTDGSNIELGLRFDSLEHRYFPYLRDGCPFISVNKKISFEDSIKYDSTGKKAYIPLQVGDDLIQFHNGIVYCTKPFCLAVKCNREPIYLTYFNAHAINSDYYGPAIYSIDCNKYGIDKIKSIVLGTSKAIRTFHTDKEYNEGLPEESKLIIKIDLEWLPPIGPTPKYSPQQIIDNNHSFNDMDRTYAVSKHSLRGLNKIFPGITSNSQLVERLSKLRSIFSPIITDKLEDMQKEVEDSIETTEVKHRSSTYTDRFSVISACKKIPYEVTRAYNSTGKEAFIPVSLNNETLYFHDGSIYFTEPFQLVLGNKEKSIQLTNCCKYTQNESNYDGKLPPVLYSIRFDKYTQSLWDIKSIVYGTSVWSRNFKLRQASLLINLDFKWLPPKSPTVTSPTNSSTTRIETSQKGNTLTLKDTFLKISQDAIDAYISENSSNKKSMQIIGEISDAKEIEEYIPGSTQSSTIVNKCKHALKMNDTGKLPVITATMKIPYTEQEYYKRNGKIYLELSKYESINSESFDLFRAITPFLLRVDSENGSILLSSEYEYTYEFRYTNYGYTLRYQPINQDLSKIKSIVYVDSILIDSQDPDKCPRNQYILINLNLEWLPPPPNHYSPQQVVVNNLSFDSMSYYYVERAKEIRGLVELNTILPNIDTKGLDLLSEFFTLTMDYKRGTAYRIPVILEIPYKGIKKIELNIQEKRIFSVKIANELLRFRKDKILFTRPFSLITEDSAGVSTFLYSNEDNNEEHPTIHKVNYNVTIQSLNKVKSLKFITVAQYEGKGKVPLFVEIYFNWLPPTAF